MRHQGPGPSGRVGLGVQSPGGVPAEMLPNPVQGIALPALHREALASCYLCVFQVALGTSSLSPRVPGWQEPVCVILNFPRN